MSERMAGYVVDLLVEQRFTLDDTFVQQYATRPVPWGFGLLSEIVYRRTYSREKPDGTRERWHDTCQRVIEGMFTVQKWHCVRLGLPWYPERAQEHAQEAYDRLFNLKWTPPGRGLWMMGTEFMYRKGSAALNNCGFTSTKNIHVDFAHPFVWAFGMSMLGVGVGFDVRGADRGMRLVEPETDQEYVHVVEDSREGWMEILRVVLSAFAGQGKLPGSIDYTQIRAKGEPIKGFGGIASGAEPLRAMFEGDDYVPGLIERLRTWQKTRGVVDSELITDIMNLTGRCVVAGGIRRTAQIALGDSSDELFASLKTDPENQPELHWWRWASNNSIFSEVGQDYTEAAARTVKLGEPGYLWLKNVRDYGRMSDPPNYADHRVEGTNPCSEQSLEDNELCCLVENAPFRCTDLDDFKRTLKYSYMYAKTVTLVPTHDARTNQVMLRNRRIGCSVTGSMQAIERLGYREYFNWLDSAYGFVRDLDDEYSDWLCVPRSVKVTSVKPSGTVSKLIGSTPGVHAAIAEYQIRRIRIADHSPVLELCRRANLPIEDAVREPNTVVVEYPLHIPGCTRTEADRTIEEQFEVVREHQRYWADNQVSVTVKYHPHEAEKIAPLLRTYDRDLKSISFLAYADPQEMADKYPQMPVEPISQEEYLRRKAEVDWSVISDIVDIEIDHDREDKFCDGDTCVVDFGG